MFKCWVKTQVAKQQAKQGVKDFFSEEKGGADSLIIAIVIIVVVVALGVVFREQLSNWVSDLFKAGEDQMNSATEAPKVSTF